MSDVGNRIKMVRTAKKMSQDDFGASLGVSRGVITNAELDRAPVKPLFLDHLCDVHGVSREWLETGEGEMFLPLTRDEQIAAFVGDLLSGEDANFKRRLIVALSRLDESDWKVLEKIAQEMAKD